MPPTGVVRLYVTVTQPYPVRRSAWVAEVLQRADEKVGCLGALCFDHASGAGFYRHGLDFDGQVVTQAAIERMLNSSAFSLEFIGTALGMIGSRLSPEKAVDISCMLHDLGGSANHPKDALKTILRVHHGTRRTPTERADDHPKPDLLLM